MPERKREGNRFKLKRNEGEIATDEPLKTQ
jgi:hypothetical protein